MDRLSQQIDAETDRDSQKRAENAKEAAHLSAKASQLLIVVTNTVTQNNKNSISNRWYRNASILFWDQ